MTSRSEASRRRTRERKYVKAEAEAWSQVGWETMINWREARMIGPGKLVTVPRDFFGDKNHSGYDLMAVAPSTGQVVGIQVTESPFERTDPTHPGWADRNAAHGAPPFPVAPPALTVSEFMAGALNPFDPHRTVVGGIAQVIVSYSDSRHPERRWWAADVD